MSPPSVRSIPAADWRSAIVGGSAALARLKNTIERVAPTTLPVLILGESGTGKEVLANALHQASGRRGPLIMANCAALSPTLIESELFGHVRGAFTGADHAYAGLIAAADGGTFFLDEIGDLPRELQAKLLRVLEERAVRAVGSSAARTVNVRIVAATCRDIESLAKANLFRTDLWYRLAGTVLTIPPLRERPEDIPPLVEHFLTTAATDGAPRKTLAPGTLDYLMRRRWPGNVRELNHAVQRAVALGEAVLTPTDFVGAPTFSQSPLTVNDLLALPHWDDIQRLLVTEALAAHGSARGVERALGLPHSTICGWLKRWGISLRPNGGLLCHPQPG